MDYRAAAGMIACSAGLPQAPLQSLWGLSGQQQGHGGQARHLLSTCINYDRTTQAGFSQLTSCLTDEVTNRKCRAASCKI